MLRVFMESVRVPTHQQGFAGSSNKVNFWAVVFAKLSFLIQVNLISNGGEESGWLVKNFPRCWIWLGR